MIHHSVLVPERIEKPELLDQNDVDFISAVESFNDLYRINRYLGGIGVYRKSLFRLIRDHPSNTKLRILDVGAGSSDMAVDVLKKSFAQKKNAMITGIDIQPGFVRLAKRNYAHVDRLYHVVSDAFRLPFNDNSFDFVISNLVLHHFHSNARSLLNEMYRVSKKAVIVNDLLRHKIPLTFFKVFSPFIARSPITKYDGEVSLRRAFSYKEIHRLLERSNFKHYSIIRHWSFRFGLVIWKETNG